MGNLWNIKARYKAAMNNEIRGQRGMGLGGGSPSGSDVIDYDTITPTGAATDFGNLTQALYEGGSCGSSTRTVHGGGKPEPAATNVIEYIVHQSTGNGADFGDLTAL